MNGYMFESFQNFVRAVILGFSLAGLASCQDADVQSPEALSNEASWKKTVRQAFKSDRLDNANTLPHFSRLYAYAALEDDGQGLFGLCKSAVDDTIPIDWKPFAEEWCIAAAEQSYPNAAAYLAENYVSGVFGEGNQDKAERWFERAKRDKEAEANEKQRLKIFQDLWGGFWEEGPDGNQVRREIKSYEPALLEITELANSGDTDAMMFLASRFYNGYGVEQSDDTYFYWTMQAAEAGHSGAAWSLGHWYNFSDGKQRDRQKALKWYERSIKLGLGAYDIMHTNPVRFVQQLRAEERMKKSNRLSDEEILDQLHDVGRNGHTQDDIAMCEVALNLRDEIPRKLRYCQNLPRYFPKKQLRFNHSFSLRNVRLFAKEVFYSDQLAEDWFQTVVTRMQDNAINGNSDYANALAYECAGDLLCIEKWEKIAISGFEQQAAQGDPGAMYNLAAIYSGRYQSKKIGNSYRETEPPIKSETLSGQWLSKAIVQYRKAADAGDADAQFNLGFFYDKGIGVQENRELSRDLFAKFLYQNSPQRLSYFHLSGGHSNVFNELREACRQRDENVETFTIMTGNVYFNNLDDLDCSQKAEDPSE